MQSGFVPRRRLYQQEAETPIHVSVWGARQHGPQCVHERTAPADSVIL